MFMSRVCERGRPRLMKSEQVRNKLVMKVGSRASSVRHQKTRTKYECHKQDILVKLGVRGRLVKNWTNCCLGNPFDFISGGAGFRAILCSAKCAPG